MYRIVLFMRMLLAISRVNILKQKEVNKTKINIMYKDANYEKKYIYRMNASISLSLYIYIYILFKYLCIMYIVYAYSYIFIYS